MFQQDPAVLAADYTFLLSSSTISCMGAVPEEMVCILTQSHMSYGFSP